MVHAILTLIALWIIFCTGVVLVQTLLAILAARDETRERRDYQRILVRGDLGGWWPWGYKARLRKANRQYKCRQEARAKEIGKLADTQFEYPGHKVEIKKGQFRQPEDSLPVYIDGIHFSTNTDFYSGAADRARRYIDKKAFPVVDAGGRAAGGKCVGKKERSRGTSASPEGPNHSE